MPRYNNPRRTWKYTEDFKVKAVRLTLQNGILVKQVADGLGIHPMMLSRWRKEYRDGRLRIKHMKRHSIDSKHNVISDKELTENARLKIELEKLKQENDLLKKWQRYLAEVHQNDLDSSKDTES